MLGTPLKYINIRSQLSCNDCSKDCCLSKILFDIVCNSFCCCAMTVRDYSPSDGSEGTAEDMVGVAVVHKHKKKRSLRGKKKQVMTGDQDLQQSLTDSDLTVMKKSTTGDEDAGEMTHAVVKVRHLTLSR